jgi:hypothetical protein
MSATIQCTVEGCSVGGLCGTELVQLWRPWAGGGRRCACSAASLTRPVGIACILRDALGMHIHTYIFSGATIVVLGQKAA